MKRSVWTAAALSFGLVTAAVLVPFASAHGPHGHQNLKVIEARPKALDAGMKVFSKGLGVKCSACHVKGKFESDEVEAKLAAREFFAATIGEKDAAKRAAALAALKTALSVETIKSEAQVWKAVDGFKKKTSKEDHSAH